MKKILIAILLVTSFIAEAQEIPPAYFDRRDSTIVIVVYESNMLVRKRYKLHTGSLSGAALLVGGQSLSYGDFFGSTNNRSFWWKTNNAYRGVFDSTGKLGIGLPFGQRPLATIDIWGSATGDTLFRVWDIVASVTRFMILRDGSVYANGYLIWNPAQAALHGDKGNFDAVVNVPAINSDGGAGTPLIINGGGYTAGIGVGGTPSTKALLDLQSTTKGFLPPRLNTTQQNAISSPPSGLMIWNTDSLDYCKYNGSAWLKVSVISSADKARYDSLYNGLINDSLTTVEHGGKLYLKYYRYGGGVDSVVMASNVETIILAASDETTAITTGTAKLTFRLPYAYTLVAVKASLTTASSSGIPTFDINESGTTVLSTKLTIDASEKTSTTAVSAAVISDSALADDAEITIDFDVAGTGAKGVKIVLYVKRS